MEDRQIKKPISTLSDTQIHTALLNDDRLVNAVYKFKEKLIDPAPILWQALKTYQNDTQGSVKY